VKLEEAQSGKEMFPLKKQEILRKNDDWPVLLEMAIQRKEGKLASTGAFAAVTGLHTGRSVMDKFIVRDDLTDPLIWWDNTQPMTPQNFQNLYDDFLNYAEGRPLFVQDLHAGADAEHRLSARIYTELAWHALFIRHLLRIPQPSELGTFVPEFTIVNLPGFKADPARHGVNSETAIACDFSRGLVLICNTSYAGETKKSVFSYLNFILPQRNVLPMHCSANEGADKDCAIFFGLSGTGKTTLSSDPQRRLLGDDEHGWSNNGVFNFEGGCYAKTIKLSKEAEPEIYAASTRLGTVYENVVLDEKTRVPNFDDGSLTENTRSAYPMSFIPNASETATSGHPRNIIMLTADAFGVLPPISKLTPSQAMYHFLSGYTAKVAGTEKGLVGVEATFSTCFGAPFMSLHPTVYGNLLRDFIAKHNVDCWLVNTGWTGGAYGVGSRMPIQATRLLVNAALDGSLANVEMRENTIFGFEVPVSMPGITSKILNPRDTWEDKDAYDRQAVALVKMFSDNFKKFENQVDPDVKSAAPGLQAAE